MPSPTLYSTGRRARHLCPRHSSTRRDGTGGGGGDWCQIKLAVVNLAEAPGFRVVNLAAKLKRQISHANLTWLPIPPPLFTSPTCSLARGGREALPIPACTARGRVRFPHPCAAPGGGTGPSPLRTPPVSHPRRQQQGAAPGGGCRERGTQAAAGSCAGELR